MVISNKLFTFDSEVVDLASTVIGPNTQNRIKNITIEFKECTFTFNNEGTLFLSKISSVIFTDCKFNPNIFELTIIGNIESTNTIQIHIKQKEND